MGDDKKTNGGVPSDLDVALEEVKVKHLKRAFKEAFLEIRDEETKAADAAKAAAAAADAAKKKTKTGSWTDLFSKEEE